MSLKTIAVLHLYFHFRDEVFFSIEKIDHRIKQ